MACGGDNNFTLMGSTCDGDGLHTTQHPNLDGPDQNHLYVGYDLHDDQCIRVYQQIKKRLESEGLYLYHHDKQLGSSTDIDFGIKSSRKVLIIVTKSYMDEKTEDDWFMYESYKSRQKMEVRSTPRALAFLLVDVKQRELPTALQGYTTIQYSGDGTQTETYLDQLLRFIREDVTPKPATVPRGNMGNTLACAHFYGYLRFVLPGLCERIKASGVMDVGGAQRMSLKMFVILPVSCRCPTDMCSMDVAISQHSIIPYNVDKGGICARDYKATVYEIKHNNVIYRAVLEFPGVLTTLYDMVRDGASGMNQEECRREVDMLYFHLKSLLDCHGLLNTIKLIYVKEDGEIFLDQVVRSIEEEIASEVDHPVQKTGCSMLSPMRPVERTHLKVTREDDQISCYNLSVEKRGKAYIINNQQFEGSSRLKFRSAAEEDTERMKDLFEKLRFDVEVYKNQTAAQMKDFVARLTSRDFTNDHAVIFCLMTHGKLGQLYGTDGMVIRITDITSQIAQIESLHRKPKMFFIQACQRGREPSSTELPLSSEAAHVDEEVTDSNTSSDFAEDSSRVSMIQTSDDMSVNLQNSKSSPSTDTIVREPLQKLTLEEQTSPNSPVQAIGSINFSCKDTASLKDVSVCMADSDSSPDDCARADLVPGAPDFLMSYATLPGCLSWRYSSFGAFYVHSLHKMVLMYQGQMALDRILMKVSEDVKEKMERIRSEEQFDKRQFPFHLHTMDKLIHL